MAIKNEIDGLLQEKTEIDTILAELGNPAAKEHIDDLPIPPQAKEVLTKMLTLILHNFKRSE